MSGPLRLTVYAMVASMTSALTLTAVYSSGGWFFPVMIAVFLVSASCALIRWSPLPSVLEPITAAVAVLLWVTWLYARPQAKLGFLPGRESLRVLDHLARSGFTDIRKLPPPVPTHHGLLLITIVGTSVVALVVDLLTVTLRRAALAGMPLLALFTICAATSRNGVNTVAFMPAAAGFLMLLYADNRERVTRWGAAMGAGNARPAPTRSAENLLPSAPASLGRRVGAAAIGVSVVIPLAIPGFHTGFGGHNGAGGHGNHGGGGSVTTIDPIVSVNHDLTSSLNAPVLGYTTSTSTPSYLRMTSLDQYSAGSFTAKPLNADPRARVTNGLGVTPPSEQLVTTKVAVARSFAFRWLPMPTVATFVEASGDWRYDPVTATTFSASNTTSGLRYTVVSAPNLPSPNQLARAQAAPNGVPPADLETPSVSAAVRQLTRQVTTGANSKFDAALQIQRFLTSNGFGYSTHPPTAPGDMDSLTFFLTVSRTGFCQQYATAMAVMARLVGIPSRVAVGFTPGVRQNDGEWVVTTHDAHAWPELYFPQYGWLPFEPTPRGDGQTVTPTYARAVPNHHGGKAGPKSGVDNPIIKPTATPGKAGSDTNPGQKSSVAAGRTPGSSFGGTWWIVAGALVLLALITPSSARQLTRRRRMLLLHGSHPAPDAAWAELRDSTIDAGGPWRDDRSPRQSAVALARWLTASPDVRAALGRLTRAEEEHRYSASPHGPVASLAADVRLLRSALRQRRSRRRSLRAVLLPPSTMRRVSTWWSAMADGFDESRPRGLSGRRRGLAR